MLSGSFSSAARSPAQRPTRAPRLRAQVRFRSRHRHPRPPRARPIRRSSFLHQRMSRHPRRSEIPASGAVTIGPLPRCLVADASPTIPTRRATTREARLAKPGGRATSERGPRGTRGASAGRDEAPFVHFRAATAASRLAATQAPGDLHCPLANVSSYPYGGRVATEPAFRGCGRVVVYHGLKTLGQDDTACAPIGVRGLRCRRRASGMLFASVPDAVGAVAVTLKR